LKPSLLITRRMPDRVAEAAAERFALSLRDDEAPLTEAEAAAALQGHDAILATLGDRFTADAFGAGPARAGIVANFGVGYNHISTDGAKAAGVMVTNTPGAVTDATADIAMTLLLMTARRAAEGERLVRSGLWTGWQPTQMLGAHVSGKRIGIVGLGRIGKAIARRAHCGFGMEVRFFNRSRIDDPGLPAVQLDSLHAVMDSDFVVLAVPASPATRHLIDASALAAMPAHGILINFSRGDVIYEAALILALQARAIAGAGLDVYEQEPVVPAALRALDNAALLPHLGTAALEVREAMGMMALDNLLAWADGGVPPNRVA